MLENILSEQIQLGKVIAEQLSVLRCLHLFVHICNQLQRDFQISVPEFL